MLHATHIITIGSDRYSSPSNSRLIRLTHSARMDTMVNVCNITMAPPLGLTVNPGDDIEVELGNGQSSGVVFTGKITTVDWQIDEMRIEAATSSQRLVLARYNMYFEQSSAGTIVNSLCSEASVTAGQVDDGLTFEYYAVGSNQNAADHIRLLALRCGFDSYTDEKDQLVFAMPLPGNPYLLQYGVNILSMRLQIPGDGIGTTALFGESPASFGQGSSAASWLTKKEVNASATAGNGMTIALFDPAIRTVSQAGLAAQHYQDAFKPRKNGNVRMLGDPSIKPGHSVQVSSMPVSEQNGLYKVAGVEHLVDRHKGFITKLTIEEV